MGRKSLRNTGTGCALANPKFLRSVEKYGIHFGHFPAWKSLEGNLFGLLVWKKKIIFRA